MASIDDIINSVKPTPNDESINDILEDVKRFLHFLSRCVV